MNYRYKCPLCGAILSEHEFRNIEGHHSKKGGRRSIFLIPCPKCLKESYFYNAEGEIDSGSWIFLNESGEVQDPLTSELMHHNFEPRTLIECTNTCCTECIFATEKYGYHDYGHTDQCNQRARLKKTGYQAGLSSWGVIAQKL